MHLYLFAHQDDEFALLKSISLKLNSYEDVLIVYLTDGGYGGIAPAVRNAESIKVLSMIGVTKEQIIFLGETHSLNDGSLHKKFDIAWTALQKLLKNYEPVTSVSTLAWEGGHQDHDATYAIAAFIANKYNCLEASSQVAAYNGYNAPWLLFRTLSPLQKNGTIYPVKIPIKQRFKFILLFLNYRSQKKTWLGLLPFVATKIICRGAEYTQPISLARVYESPHKDKLLYEKRGFCSEREFRQYMEKILFPIVNKDIKTD
jgi:hypothetical protein